MSSPSPLEPSPEAFRTLMEAAVERALDHVGSLSRQPTAPVAEAEAQARRLREPLPEEGAPFEALLTILFDHAVPPSFNTASPGYLAYIPGGGLLHTAVADFLADVVNRYTGVWQAAPALVELEANVLRWFAALVGFSPTARGFLTSGGSLANFGAVVTARRTRLPDDFLDGVLYASDQVHHSVVKAAVLAGFPASRVRCLTSDESFRLPVDTLAEAVAEDRARGLQPFLVVASAGTTNSGAIDDLPALAALCRRTGLWLHVDAAYGGFFLLTERGRRQLTGVEEADSVVLDPHKGLFLPYGTGALLVRDGAALARAHHAEAAYLPPLKGGEEWWDFCSLSPELSRPFRGLRIWLPLKMLGARAFREALDEKLDLARWAAAEVAAIPGMEILAPPELSLFAFRLAPRGVAAGELDGLNRAVLARVNARGRVHLTGTELKGTFALRICVLSFRTHGDRMEMALEDLREAVAAVSSPSGPPAAP